MFCLLGVEGVKRTAKSSLLKGVNNHVIVIQNQYKIGLPFFGAADAAPKIGEAVLY